jgi:hypothetical protein
MLYIRFFFTAEGAEGAERERREVDRADVTGFDIFDNI